LVHADEATHRQLAEELLLSMNVPQNLRATFELMMRNMMPSLKDTLGEKDPQKTQLLADKMSSISRQSCEVTEVGNKLKGHGFSRVPGNVVHPTNACRSMRGAGSQEEEQLPYFHDMEVI
jgi:hypothetical protein